MILNHKKKKRSIIKPSRLIFLIVLIASNTFAWFIYATKINSTVSVHVRAWNIVFEAEDTQISDTLNLNVDSIYPGMEDYEYEIKAYNRSEVPASMTYQVLSAKILGDEYITREEKEILGQEVSEDDITCSQLEQKLLNDYPFHISFNTSSNLISVGNGQATYSFNVVWPYESNHDDIDTMWGINSYQYKESNPGEPSITLKVKITITQNPN